jgi:nucleoside-triphosphatase THEP1
MPQEKPEIIIVTGKVNSGKTTILEKLLADEKLKGISPTGIIARGVFEGKAKVGFDVKDLSDGTSMPLARIGRMADHGFSVGKYSFSAQAFKFAQKAILNFRNNGVVFIDEVGPLELKGGGYAGCLNVVLESDISRLYVTVRSEILPEFSNKFIKSNPTKIITADQKKEYKQL